MPSSRSPLLEWSMRLTLLGLLVEIGTLFKLHHSLGFMIFMVLGCTLIGAGIVCFLLFLLRSRHPEGS